MAMLEAGLRAPLEHAGIKGWPQTLLIALVPLLTLIAAVRLLHRIIRAVVASLLFAFLLYILWPVVLDLYMMAVGLK